MMEISEKEMHQIDALLTAHPSEEKDHSKIKWPKIKKWRRPKQSREFAPKTRWQDPNRVYYDILIESGREVKECQACGSTLKITIHHIDHNHFNNLIENLAVLCWDCHRKVHSEEEQGIYDEDHGCILEDFW